MLYIANMGCSRISVCLLIKKVLPGSGVRYTCCGFAILSIIWTIADILVTAFPCELPDPWNFLGKDCIDIVKFVLHIGVTNIWIEVVLIVMPLIVWNLRLSAGSSISVSAVFLSRLRYVHGFRLLKCVLTLSSVIAAVAAELVYFSRSARSKDLTYDMWSTVLCKQIAQNLSIITACLPCFHPFMLSILSGAVKAEKLRYDYKKRWTVKCMFNRRRGNFDATTSQSSTRPMKDSMTDHCRPLATHGLIRSSTHINSQQFNNFPPDIESPMEKPREPENVFMRHIDISDTSPGSFSSAQPLQPAPKDLSQVGIIPTPDWDTGSSDRSSAQSDRSRRPGSDYVFSRQKVISVPENNAMYDQDSWRRYPPPPKSGEK
jgi:hypothetical protein